MNRSRTISPLRILSLMAIVALLGVLVAGFQVPVKASGGPVCPTVFPACTDPCPPGGGCTAVNCELVGQDKQCLYSGCDHSCTNSLGNCLGDPCKYGDERPVGPQSSFR